ncbi:MAG: IspD/TarI family cytidylyltransferase [Eubacteriales bacterium]|nr:IspD/TarI family cytidylyltransferase [Eubacteriales bacterium]
MNIAMILAGGSGLRAGGKRPKQFTEVLGKPVLAYTCEIFEANDRIDAIEVVCHYEWIDYCREMIAKYDLTKVRWIVSCGKTFQESVMNGIEHLKRFVDEELRLDDNIFIQYGGAPFTSQKIVDAVIDMTKERGSAVTGTPCYQLLSMKDSSDDTKSSIGVNRDNYIQIACPYGFRFSYLIDIYKRAEDLGLLETTDPHTTSLMFALGDAINLAYGDQTNIKITTKEDLELFKWYVLAKSKYIVQNGGTFE